MATYPFPIDENTFPKIDGLDKPDAPRAGSGEMTLDVGATVMRARAGKSSLHGVTKVALVVGDQVSGYQNNGKGNGEKKGKFETPHEAFVFAPGVEDPTVIVKLRNLANAEKVTFELYCRSQKEPLAKTDKTIEEVARMESSQELLDRDIRHTAAMKLSELFNLRDVKIGDAIAFPDGVPTYEHSPYQLRVTVTSKEATKKAAYPTVAWVNFQVQVAGIELFFGPKKVLANSPSVRRDQSLQRDHQAYGYVIADGGRVPDEAGKTRRVLLDANFFYQDANELNGNMHYEVFKHKWGDGPRIPIFARVLIRNAKGERIEAPSALGGAGVFWEWEDAFELPATLTETQKAFVEAAHDYHVNDQDFPGKNCHVDRGGKRGAGATRVLPLQDGSAEEWVPDQTFPFKVEAAAHRKRMVRSHFRRNGDYAGLTGVLFAPGIIAGDAYRLNVYLGTAADLDKADAKLDEVPEPLRFKSGRFEIWRKVDVVAYWQLDPDASPVSSPELNDAQEELKKAFVYLGTRPPQPAQDHFWNAVRSIAEDTDLLDVDWGPALRALDKEKLGASDRAASLPFKPYEAWVEALREWKDTEDALNDWAKNFKPTEPGPWNQNAKQISEPDSAYVPYLSPYPVQIVMQDGGIVGAVTVKFYKVQNGETEATTKLSPVAYKRTTRTLHRTVTFTPDAVDSGLRAACKKFVNELTWGSIRTSDSRAKGKIVLEVKKEDKGGPRARDQVKGLIEQELRQGFIDSGSGTYKTMIGYSWAFRILEGAIEKLLETQPLEGLIILHSTKLTQFGGPAGKSGFACDDRRTSFVPLLIANDDHIKNTIKHEISHELFLNHPFLQQGQGDADTLQLHDQAAKGACTMYTPSLPHPCGFCLLRLGGWSIFKVQGNNVDTSTRVLKKDAKDNRA